MGGIGAFLEIFGVGGFLCAAILTTAVNGAVLWWVVNRLGPEEEAGASFRRCCAAAALLSVVFAASILILLIPIPYAAIVIMAAVGVWYKGSTAVIEGIFEKPGGNFGMLAIYTLLSVALWGGLGWILPGNATRALLDFERPDPMRSAMQTVQGWQEDRNQEARNAIHQIVRNVSTGPPTYTTQLPSQDPTAPMDPSEFREPPKKASEIPDKELAILQIFRSPKLEQEDLPKVVDEPQSHIVLGIFIRTTREMYGGRSPFELLHPGPALEDKGSLLDDWPKQGDHYQTWIPFRVVPAKADSTVYDAGTTIDLRSGKVVREERSSYYSHPEDKEGRGPRHYYIFFAVKPPAAMREWFLATYGWKEGAEYRRLGDLSKTLAPANPGKTPISITPIYGIINSDGTVSPESGTSPLQ